MDVEKVSCEINVGTNSLNETKKNGELNSNLDVNDLPSWELQEPDLHTRMFYAQRYVESQYQFISKRGNSISRRWNDFIYKTLKIETLNDDGIEYPKWTNNNLSTRTTEWFVCVGLITSEIMGAVLVPNSMSLIGYVPSNIMLVVCFSLTLLSGGAIWWCFMLFDSPEYPVKTFAELAYIIGGQTCKQAVIFLQLISTILTCAVIIITSAECVVILRTTRVCFVGIMVLISGIMMLFSLMKKLSSIGRYCLVVSVINYIGLFVQLGFIGNTEPNWETAESILGVTKGQIKTFAIVPGQSLIYRVVAVANISYVFAGSIVFPEIISEMKCPWEFWKSMVVAELIILFVYLLYGNYIYSNQGQFSNSPSVFGISNMNALKGLAFITFITSFFQGLLFGHISCKIVYKNYMPMLFRTIKFQSKLGALLWILTVFIVWVIIFIIGAGVPQVSAVSAFTSSLTITPLTYVIPFIIYLILLYRKENTKCITDFVPYKTDVNRVGLLAFCKRGFRKYWHITCFFLLLCLASTGFLGMGLWASVEYMKYIFAVTNASSFSCTSPI